MSANPDRKLKFEVETRRIIEILSDEIYDSPLALLRENVQNGYDAILMRSSLQDRPPSDFSLTVTVAEDSIEIVDEGIGMDEAILEKNYWKAGSSGKRGDLARKAGVIGTFGIGAMANFGVSHKLVVESKQVDSETTYISSAERAKLSISEHCIDIAQRKDDRGPGTRVIAYLDKEHLISPQAAIDYLLQYVQFIPVPVNVNGQLISQRSLDDMITKRLSSLSPIDSADISTPIYSGKVEVFADANSLVSAKVTSLSIRQQPVTGELVLVQNHGTLQGLRNFFGLSDVPVAGNYNLGGFANLSFLQPTAGREAISRESINTVNEIISLVEDKITELLAMTAHADNNVHFMQHVLTHNRIDLAGNVTIDVLPDEQKIPLAQEKAYDGGNQRYYYLGRDPSTINQFSSAGMRLLLVSQSNPRRKLQTRYICELMTVEAVPDTVRIDRLYSYSELSTDEIALKIRITTCLNEDYLLPDVDVQFADISHNVTIQAKNDDGKVSIFIARNCAVLRPVLEVYSTSYDIFGPFVKDFVRNQIFPHVSSFIPSSKRQGVESLKRVLAERRELYRYESTEIGDMEPLISDFMTGKIGFGEVLRKSHSIGRSQAQRVKSDQVGGVEAEIPDLADSPSHPADTPQDVYEPAPAILRTDATTKMKVLTTESTLPQLNNFHVFLALSDRVFKREYDFFLSPHSTKIIWGSHRVIYIFTHVSNLLTLYYDIELKERMSDESVGGGAFPTTTIVMKNRIFIPIPERFASFFRISSGTKEFYVTYDAIGE